MGLPAERWHSWNRIKLRVLTVSRYESFLECAKDIVLRHLSSTTEVFLQRLVLLTWIGELKLAKKLFEEQKEQHYFWGFPETFEDLLFRVLICEKHIGPVYEHPEFDAVQYLLLDEEDAFKLSTIPLSELLKMDKPHFSSVDGLITVDFDKHELGRIAKIVPEGYQKELRLPLILLRKEVGYVDLWKEVGYFEPCKPVGTKLENMLFQRLLKLTKAPFEKYAEVEEKRELTSISMLRRRRFNTIYKVLPESSTIWIRTCQLPGEK